MADYVSSDSSVIEIGARRDRGVISKRIIPHKSFVSADKNPRRGDVTADALQEDLTADVILSTCVLHHTREQDIPVLLSHCHAPLLMFSGPNVRVLPDLFGDHQWHIDEEALTAMLDGAGYNEVMCDPIGISEPFCEVLVVARR